MVFLEERIGRLLKEIETLIYPREKNIQQYKIKKTTERFKNISKLDTSDWDSFEYTQFWGGHREYYWFETTVKIPEEFDNECVVYEITTGREGEWDATNPQFTVYVNGKLIQGLDVNHRSIILTKQAKKGEEYRIILSAFTGDQNFNLYLKSSIKVLDRLTEKYYYDILVPFNVAVLLDQQDKVYIDIIKTINESVNILDLRQHFSRDYYKSLERAQNYIISEFYDKYCGDSEAKVFCVGHTHIDVAWMWTLAVTRDKVVRSFSTVLELMRHYPEYIFMSSQPQLYKYVKENAPEVYGEIQKRVKEGRWEPDGAMFVEADCNIASGESIIRQILFGKRFFKEEFNCDNKILWLPDVFGYSAALPQIMQKCGLPYFMTTKISWNEFNKIPYDTFMWEGIDGSKVLTHFIPVRDYNSAAEKGSFKTEHFTTYNGTLTPSQVKGAWQRYQQKHVNDEVLMAFGFGDGGGGPTKDMLENQRRLAKGIPGCPKTVMTTAREFFEELEKDVTNHKYLPVWSGELYLEYHRGTYTSMGRNKKYNRMSEFAYQNAELYSTIDNILLGGKYPQKVINEGWEVILRNQFHDILPGTSIKEVHDESKEEYEVILKSSSRLIDTALNHIVNHISTPKNSLVVFNPNGFDVSEVIEFEIPEDVDNPIIMDGDIQIPCQKLTCQKALVEVINIPAKGFKSFTLKDKKIEIEKKIKVSKNHIETPFLEIKLNEKGQFTSIFDKMQRREVIQPGACANVIMSYEDKPHNYDAWDINNYYVEKSWEIDDIADIEVVECGALRGCLKIKRHYLNSTITQYIYVYSTTPKIDIKNEIDWKEEQIFLKALFPIDVHTNEATFDIQYGNVKRATHYNTSWDFARFEVCTHKWIDLSEDDYGVSFLNDCKYGCSTHNSVVGLSMLKSAIDPNPGADKEYHEFSFAIYPHKGDWKQAKTVEEAYKFNNQLTALIKTNEPGKLPPHYSFVQANNENIIIEVVKKSEDSQSTIIRLYECYNRRTQATLTFAEDILEVYECDMLENEQQEILHDLNTANFTLMPYEIKTLKVVFE